MLSHETTEFVTTKLITTQLVLWLQVSYFWGKQLFYFALMVSGYTTQYKGIQTVSSNTWAITVVQLISLGLYAVYCFNVPLAVVRYPYSKYWYF